MTSISSHKTGANLTAAKGKEKDVVPGDMSEDPDVESNGHFYSPGFCDRLREELKADFALAVAWNNNCIHLMHGIRGLKYLPDAALSSFLFDAAFKYEKLAETAHAQSPAVFEKPPREDFTFPTGPGLENTTGVDLDAVIELSQAFMLMGMYRTHFFLNGENAEPGYLKSLWDEIHANGDPIESDLLFNEINALEKESKDLSGST